MFSDGFVCNNGIVEDSPDSAPCTCEEEGCSVCSQYAAGEAGFGVSMPFGLNKEPMLQSMIGTCFPVGFGGLLLGF